MGASSAGSDFLLTGRLDLKLLRLSAPSSSRRGADLGLSNFLNGLSNDLSEENLPRLLLSSEPSSRFLRKGLSESFESNFLYGRFSNELSERIDLLRSSEDPSSDR